MDIHRVYRPLLRGFRRRRMRRFAAHFRPDATTRILDVGGTSFNWMLLDERPQVTLLNLAPSREGALPPSFTELTASGEALPYADGSFDIVFSNSVIEHVGGDEARRVFASELRRVAPRLWIQTPARSFFFEPHLLTPFFHYLPRRWQRRWAHWGTVWGWLTGADREQAGAFVDGTELLGAEEFGALFPDCRVQHERFLGWTKAYVAVRG